jgi:DNA-directed RNA polymerase alpha subunit
MSASHRKIARLPLEVFDNLLVTPQEEEEQQQHQFDPEVLRSSICARLKRFPIKSRNATTTSTRSVKTVGDLLRTSKRTLLHALDPLLTYGTYKYW